MLQVQRLQILLIFILKGVFCQDWTLVSVVGTPPISRIGHTSVKISSNQFAVFGGTIYTSFVYPKMQDLHIFNKDTQTWTEITNFNGTTPPLGRVGHSAIYVPSAGNMVVFGGILDDNSVVNEVWIFNFATSTWSSLTTTGDIPSIRYSHSATYSPTTNSMLVFGGTSVPAGRPMLNDFYSLNLNSFVWTQVNQTNTITARRRHQSFLVNGNFIVFGGETANTRANDAQSFDFGTQTWTELWTLSLGFPYARDRYVGEILSTGNIAIYGGSDIAGSPLNDTWIFSPPTKTWMSVSATGPQRLYASSAIFQDVIYLFGGGGQGVSEFYNDTYTLDLSSVTFVPSVIGTSGAPVTSGQVTSGRVTTGRTFTSGGVTTGSLTSGNLVTTSQSSTTSQSASNNSSTTSEVTTGSVITTGVQGSQAAITSGILVGTTSTGGNAESDSSDGLATKWIILIAVGGTLILAVLLIVVVALAITAKRTSRKRKERRMREMDSF